MEEPLAFGNPKERCVCASSTTLVIVFLVLFNCFLDAKVLPDDEVQILRLIKTKYKISRWNVGQNSCINNDLRFQINNHTFSNVTCDCTFNNSGICHVTNIQLKNVNISGPLPDEFANLTFLIEIELSHNYFSGTIPKSWAKLPLVNLSISANLVGGWIPKEIGDISTLEELVIGDNQFEGPIPPELGKLTGLRRLVCFGNNFTGILPPKLGDLKNLTDFRIDGSGISGRIPDFIGNWTKIKRLDMLGTSMVGPIPSTISLLKNLIELRITDLQGPNITFPDIQGLTKIKYLYLRNCSINGQIPNYIGQTLPGLKKLDLSFNRLTGEIPENLQDLEILEFLYLANNLLTGKVPPFISSDSNHKVDISFNNFTGPASASSDCVSTNVNMISSYSSLDNSIDNWCLIKDLPCYSKHKYHSFFINCGGPEMVAEGQKYEIELHEMGPSSFFSTNRWAVSTTGDFMDNDHQSYTAKTSIAITDGDLYRTARLAPMSLKYFGLCLRQGSYRVKLHFAEIMFIADRENNYTGKRIFDVAIQGRRVLSDFNIAEQAAGIGKKVVREFDVNVTATTLEIHLYWTGKGTRTVPSLGVYGPLISAITVTPNFDPSTGLHIGAIVGIVVASCVLVLLVLAFLWKKGYLGEKEEDKEFRSSLELQTSCFSLRQIKDATCNFDLANKIGEGGFGPVYKGTLPDGSLIAVKQLSSKSKQGNREFVNEIGMISALQHPNLVKLFGCCIEGNQLLLIYEYMENNSLARALFGHEEQKLNLDWPTRRNICMGVARGLAYLHEESRLKIVHRDIKATNVLLDKDLNAKISDFGLARLDEDENTHISTRIAGTIGYMAPEYATRGYLTDKADVYSFGIVALEIVCGKSNTTNYRTMDERVYLIDWAFVLYEQGILLELVDPSLGSKYPREEALRMLELGLLCANQSPALRPSMSSVVSMLEGKIAIQAPIVKHGSMTEAMRLKAFERLVYDNQTQVSTSSQDGQSRSTEGVWMNSSISFPSEEARMDHSSSSRPLATSQEIKMEHSSSSRPLASQEVQMEHSSSSKFLDQDLYDVHLI